MDDQSLKTATDDELLAAARDNFSAEKGRRAFDLFIERHRDFAVNLAYGYVGEPNLAEDFAQDAFLQLYQALGRYRPTGCPRAMLAVTVRNACISHLRREKRGVKFGELVIEAEGKQDNSSPKVDAELVREALRRLTPTQQEVMSLRYFSDLSYKEIAKALGLNTNNVGVVISQSLKAMKEKMGKRK